MPLYFGIFISLAAYFIGMQLKKKLGWAVLNPDRKSTRLNSSH